MLSTLLYGSETWTTYAKQEKNLNSFHMRCLRRILHIHWEEKVPDTEVCERANMNSMLAMLSERRLRWLGRVKCMEPGRIPKDMLYGEPTEGKRKAGRPLLRYKDICKRDLKLCGIDIDTRQKQANEAGSESRRGEQEGDGSPEKTKEERGEKPAIPAIPPCLHEVQQRLQIAGRPLQPLGSFQRQCCCTIISRRQTDADDFSVMVPVGSCLLRGGSRSWGCHGYLPALA